MLQYFPCCSMHTHQSLSSDLHAASNLTSSTCLFVACKFQNRPRNLHPHQVSFHSSMSSALCSTAAEFQPNKGVFNHELWCRVQKMPVQHRLSLLSPSCPCNFQVRSWQIHIPAVDTLKLISWVLVINCPAYCRDIMLLPLHQLLVNVCCMCRQSSVAMD